MSQPFVSEPQVGDDLQIIPDAAPPSLPKPDRFELEIPGVLPLDPPGLSRMEEIKALQNLERQLEVVEGAVRAVLQVVKMRRTCIINRANALRDYEHAKEPAGLTDEPIPF